MATKPANSATNTSSELQSFLKHYPLASSFDNYKDFEAYVQKNSPLSNARGLWQELSSGQIPPATEQHEAPQEQQQETPVAEDALGNLAPLVAAPLAFFYKPELMEDDGTYKKAADALKEAWLTEHNPAGLKQWKKNHNDNEAFNSKDGIMFLYETLPIETEASFKRNPKNAKKVQRYDKNRKKIYKTITKDPAVVLITQRKQDFQEALEGLADESINKLSKNERGKLDETKKKTLRNQQLHELGFEDDFDEVLKKYERGQWDTFVKNHPEKATAYASKQLKAQKKPNEESLLHTEISAALQRSQEPTPPAAATQTPLSEGAEEISTTTQKPRENGSETTSALPHTPSTEPLPTPSPSPFPQTSYSETATPSRPLTEKNPWPGVGIAATNKKPPASQAVQPAASLQEARRQAFIKFLQQITAIRKQVIPVFEREQKQEEDEERREADVIEEPSRQGGGAGDVFDTINELRGETKAAEAVEAAETAEGVGAAAEAAEGVGLAAETAEGAEVVSVAAGGAAASPVLIIAGIVIGIILLILILLFLLSPKSSTPAPTPTTGTGGDISACTFYRGGDKIQGMLFNDPQLATMVSDISAKVGVPPAVVAGIMRVETSQAFLASPDYVANDYDAHSSGVAYGLMQFLPSTFVGVFNENKTEMGNLFGKVAVRTQIDPQSAMAPANVFRIYSVRDSIIATAFKIKNDKQRTNGDGPWDQATISRIASLYYSGGTCTMYPSCSSGPYDYGDDVWKSYSNCLVASPIAKPPTGAASCPLPGKRVIGCGSFMSDPKFNTNACSGPQPEDRGHMGRHYVGDAYAGRDATLQMRRAHSIDVNAPAGETVYLPNVNGQPVTWKYVASYSVAPGDGGGNGHVFEAQLGADKWVLHLVHMNGVILPADGKSYKSGDAVTSVANTSYTHLHVNLGKNPTGANGGNGWLNPEDLGICVN